VLARPGGGKSTQAKRLAEILGVTHLSVGAILRREVAASSTLGRAVAPAIDHGDLAPDELVVGVVVSQLEAAAVDGYVLDGFPRNLVQARALAEDANQQVQPQVALLLEVSVQKCRRRLLARAGREGRSDDTAETIERRLVSYERDVMPVVELYDREGRLVTVDGEGPAEAVTSRILECLWLR
jgi:adenylate kinase